MTYESIDFECIYFYYLLTNFVDFCRQHIYDLK